MFELISNCLKKNQTWLYSSAKELAIQLSTVNDSDVEFRPLTTSSDVDLYISGERVVEATNYSLEYLLNKQLEQTDGVAVPRPFRHSKNLNSFSSGEILSQMVDQHREILLDHLPSIPIEGSQSNPNEKPPYKNLIVFGSLMLSPLSALLKHLEFSPWLSITLLEDDMRQMMASLSLFDLEDFVSICRSKGIGLTLLIDSSREALQDRLYTLLGTTNPTVLYGWQTLRSPMLSPLLMELHSWLHAPEGAAQHVLGMLGFATDEFNQTQQTIWNALNHSSMKVLSVVDNANDLPVVLVASGPSLNTQIDWLRANQQDLNIVSAGSALGALLRSGIQPSAAVFLERGALVYADLCDLLADGFSLKGIKLIVSSTIDPRVPDLFDEAIFFHRPVAAATVLFPSDQQAILSVGGPHVINAAFEALTSLGIREFLLVGADFSALKRENPRAYGALGSSYRDFTIPVSGSRGRTVFSEPGLLHTGYLLNRLIASTQDCVVYRLGEGVVLDSTINIEANQELLTRFGRSSGRLSAALETLPLSTFTCQDCVEFLNSVEEEVFVWASEISEAVSSSEAWSKSLSFAIAPWLLRMHADHSRQRRFLACLICLFMMLIQMIRRLGTDRVVSS